MSDVPVWAVYVLALVTGGVLVLLGQAIVQRHRYRRYLRDSAGPLPTGSVDPRHAQERWSERGDC